MSKKSREDIKRRKKQNHDAKRERRRSEHAAVDERLRRQYSKALREGAVVDIRDIPCDSSLLGAPDEWPVVTLASLPIEIPTWDIGGATRARDEIVDHLEPLAPAHLDQLDERLALLSSELTIEKFMRWAAKNAAEVAGSQLALRYAAFRTNKGKIIEALLFEDPLVFLVAQAVHRGLDRLSHRFHQASWCGWHSFEGKIYPIVSLRPLSPYYLRCSPKAIERLSDQTRPVDSEEVFFDEINGEVSKINVSFDMLKLLQVGDLVWERNALTRSMRKDLAVERFPHKDLTRGRHTVPANCLAGSVVAFDTGCSDLVIPLAYPSDWDHPDFEAIGAFRHCPPEEWDSLIELLENRQIKEIEDRFGDLETSEDFERLIAALSTAEPASETTSESSQQENKERPKYALPWNGPGDLSFYGPFRVYEIARSDKDDRTKRVYGFLLVAKGYGFAFRLFSHMGEKDGTTGVLGFMRLLSHGCARRKADAASGALCVIPHSGDYHASVEKALTAYVGPPVPELMLELGSGEEH